MAKGRPRTTPYQYDQALIHLANGHRMGEAAAMVGVCRETLWLKARVDEEFRTRIDAARAMGTLARKDPKRRQYIGIKMIEMEKGK